jgi:gamma-glutamyltranspeptidase/glutathione hydrolase
MTHSFDWTTGYASQRSPLFARNIVSTSHPLAAQAGLRMMQAGGNAVDAAIATAAVMTIVEPCSNGLGSDAFCILWDGQQLHGLNASGPCAPGLDARLLPPSTAPTRRRRPSAAGTR